MASYKINTLFTVTYDNLKNSINGIKSQFKSVEQSADSVKKKVNNTFENTNRDIQKNSNYIKTSSNLIDSGLKASTIAIAAITVPTILAGKSALTMAGQYEAATQTLEYTLGDAKNIVDDFVENNAQKIGMAEQDAYKFANIYSNLLTTITSDQATNAEYTNKLMQASAVIMSKTGRTFTDVSIRSGCLRSYTTYVPARYRYTPRHRRYSWPLPNRPWSGHYPHATNVCRTDCPRRRSD